MFESGKFFVGCNYWASHAGIYMWRNWDAEQVEKDLATLEKNGLQVIRMFLTWPDFQPLSRMYGGGCSLQEMRHGDKTLPDTEFGRAGLDPVMMERFKFYADCAYKHNLKLIVGLITGWMSGRMLIPPAFEGKNLHTDPEVIRWQVRFVRCFVRTFKDHPAIVFQAVGSGIKFRIGGDAEKHCRSLALSLLSSSSGLATRSLWCLRARRVTRLISARVATRG